MKTVGYVNNHRFVIHWGVDLFWLPKKYYGQAILNHILVRFTPEHPNAISRIAHEIVHTEQWRKYWYVGFLPAYLWHQVTQGYYGNALEVAAHHPSDEVETAAEVVVAKARAQSQKGTT